MNVISRTLFFVTAAFLCATSSLAQSCDNPKSLRFAVVPIKDPAVMLAQYRPLIQVLEKILERRVEFVQVTSYGAVVEGLLAGNIDLAELGPASYAQAKSRDSGITAFASPIQRTGTYTDSAAHYRSLLISRTKRGFNSVTSLRGANISLIDPASTSGALIPRHNFAQLTGEPLENYFRRVTFAGTHDRAIQLVQKGIVDAAFVSSARLDEAIHQGTVRADELIVVWKSAPIARDPFVYRGQLCATLVEKIKQSFFHENANLEGMFRSTNISGFTQVSDDNYREIRKIHASPQTR